VGTGQRPNTLKKDQGYHILEKSWIFFAVLESPGILFISPGKSLKISGRFPVFTGTE